ncbi:extracellular matrix regulator RemB [Neobacillus dielmonensis]|uniref:extracellular matrix regulator RemB n=1 Tax=Neobacillus dielmonensis TaxID=1347369 RepID=UPI0005A87DAC|nr:extracellular matrix/biofilm biosynthesis regulator RemA family protein [Neobacillus dielmonensis]
MYLHIGEDLNIRAKEIITILDKESALNSELVEEFLNHHQKQVVNLSKNPYKSIVITSEKVYLSPIASSTLKKRSSQIYINEF